MIYRYNSLSRQIYSNGDFSIVPIRFQDRFDIMRWRNEQMYHLRQSEILTEERQDHYFNFVIKPSFNQEKPTQILFSFLKDGNCIGYGGLVHINWIDKNAEISFLMKTELENYEFENLWQIYLGLIKMVAFDDLLLHKIYTYAFDLRPRLYNVLEKCGFNKEAIFKEHALFENKFINVVIHSCIKKFFILENASMEHLDQTYSWATNSEVRFYSFNKSKISLEDHTKWFYNKIEDPNCVFFIAYNDGKAIGSIRFDINNDNALISYLIDPDFQGMGFGTQILKEGIEMLNKVRCDINTISGYVKPENKASVRIFKKLHFHVEQEGDSLLFSKKID